MTLNAQAAATPMGSAVGIVQVPPDGLETISAVALFLAQAETAAHARGVEKLHFVVPRRDAPTGEIAALCWTHRRCHGVSLCGADSAGFSALMAGGQMVTVDRDAPATRGLTASRRAQRYVEEWAMRNELRDRRLIALEMEKYERDPLRLFVRASRQEEPEVVSFPEALTMPEIRVALFQVAHEVWCDGGDWSWVAAATCNAKIVRRESDGDLWAASAHRPADQVAALLKNLDPS